MDKKLFNPDRNPKAAVHEVLTRSNAEIISGPKISARKISDPQKHFVEATVRKLPSKVIEMADEYGIDYDFSVGDGDGNSKVYFTVVKDHD